MLMAGDELVHHAFVTGEIGNGQLRDRPKTRSQVIAFFCGLEPADVVGRAAFHEFVVVHISFTAPALASSIAHLLASRRRFGRYPALD